MIIICFKTVILSGNWTLSAMQLFYRFMNYDIEYNECETNYNSENIAHSDQIEEFDN